MAPADPRPHGLASRSPVLVTSSPLLLLAAVFALGGCSERARVTEPDPPGGTVEWQVGPASEYPVPSAPGGSVADSVSGCEFTFPEGGSGVLRVARIVDGADPLFPGEGFEIVYAGSEPLHMEVPANGAEDVVVMGYGQVEGCFDDELAGAPRWVSLPIVGEDAESASFLITPPFELPRPAGAVSRTGPGARWGGAVSAGSSVIPAAVPRGFDKYWISKIQAGTDEADRRIFMKLQAQTYVDSFLAALSPATRAAAQAEVANRLRLEFAWDGEYYKGFWWRSLGSSGRLVKPTVHVRTSSNAASLAHELGHYLTHVLVGDDTQSALEGQAPFFAGHGIRDEVGRTHMVEDYAYLVQFFLTGGVGTIDLLDPYAIFQGMSPLTKDFPSVEGFPSVVIASLARSEPQMRDQLTGRRVPVPVVDLPWSQIFDLYQARALGVEGVVTEIERVIGADKKKLSAILGHSGWSYSVRGRYVDGTGAPLSGYTTTAVQRIDGVVYENGFTTTPSGSDGSFSVVGGVYGGASELRAVSGQDTTYLPITIAWSKKTNERVELGDLAIVSRPVVTGVTPKYAQPGEPVTIIGRGFGSGPEPRGTETAGTAGTFVAEGSFASSVTIGGVPATTTSWADGAITAIVPAGLSVGETTVIVNVGEASSEPAVLGVDDEVTAILRGTGRIDFLFHAPHRWDPWWIGEDESFDHLLQTMTWDGYGFEGGRTEAAGDGEMKLVYSGSLDLATRTMTIDYTFTDSQTRALVKSKHVRIEGLPFDRIVAGRVKFGATGAGVQAYVRQLSWTGTADDGGGGTIEGHYVETDWTYPDGYYTLVADFQR